MAIPQTTAEEGVAAGISFKMQAYEALKESILAMDVYGQRGEIRIDDREVAMLEELAGIVSDELEMRLEVRKALERD